MYTDVLIFRELFPVIVLHFTSIHNLWHLWLTLKVVPSKRQSWQKVLRTILKLRSTIMQFICPIKKNFLKKSPHLTLTLSVEWRKPFSPSREREERLLPETAILTCMHAHWGKHEHRNQNLKSSSQTIGLPKTTKSWVFNFRLWNSTWSHLSSQHGASQEKKTNSEHRNSVRRNGVWQNRGSEQWYYTQIQSLISLQSLFHIRWNLAEFLDTTNLRDVALTRK